MAPVKEFIITDGTKFIRQNLDGKYEQVSNLAIADVYNNKRSALNVMLNSIPKVWSRSYYVAEKDGANIVQVSMSRPPKTKQLKGNKGFSFDARKRDEKWYDKFVGIETLFEIAEKRNCELSQELSNVESTILDLEHYIEFCSLNARDGYKVYKKLQELLAARRELKNEQKVIMAISGNHDIFEKIKHITQAIQNGTGREYKPRVLLDLFESGISTL